MYSFSGMNDSFINGCIGGQYLPQYHISAGIGQCYSVYCPILKVFLFALTLMIIITMIHTVTCHVCHLWIKPVSLAARVYEQVDGRVRVGSRPGECFAWPACSPGLNPIGQLWDQLGRAVRTRVTIATMQDLRQIVVDEWNAIPQQRCSAAHIQYEAAVRGCCCGIWWFHPMLMLKMSRMKSNVVKPSVFLT